MAKTIANRLRDIIGDQFGAAVVEHTLEKALEAAKDRAADPKAHFHDPISLFMGQEWLVSRNYRVNWWDLRGMAKNPIIGSIVNTRLNQMASFMHPFHSPFEPGFIIKSKMQDQTDEVRAKELTMWLNNSGIEGYGEPDLETLCRKMMRDSLILDQACAEIVNRRNGDPAYMVAVDGGTMRKLKKSLDYATPEGATTPIYAQVIQERIVARFSQQDMIFAIRNPSTDVRNLGYGRSELEDLVRTVTTLINADHMNAGKVTQGGTHKGVMVVKGEVSKPEMDSFRRDFREAVRNASRYWRPPVLNVSKDADIDWVKLDQTNRDMEYAQMFDYLVKQACGIYQIDPAEINWQIGATGSSMTFESRTSGKISASQRKGLRPLLTFFANTINQCIIDRIDDRFMLEFTGTLHDRAEDGKLLQTEVSTYRTVNEVRSERGLDPIEGGDTILSFAYLRNKDAMAAAEEEEEFERQGRRNEEEEAEEVDLSAEFDGRQE